MLMKDAVSKFIPVITTKKPHSSWSGEILQIISDKDGNYISEAIYDYYDSLEAMEFSIKRLEENEKEKQQKSPQKEAKLV